MIYTTGTIAINGNTVTGTGTNFSEPLSLIRVGCTLIAVGNPVQIFTITEIKSGTELSVTPAANPAIAAGTKFSILLSDSISVDGLAQDVAETLRYYQSKETEIAAAVEWWNEFGGDGQMEQLLADIRTETAKSTANAQKTESDKNAAASSKAAAANSATAAKASQDAAKASETAASNSKTAAVTSETNAAKSAADALNYRNQAQGIVGDSIGLGTAPRDCPDISGNPSGYIGFLRIREAATGFPSIASGEAYLTGFISGNDVSPAYAGVFQGWNTRSLYTYRWVEDIGPQWTRHARKDELDENSSPQFRSVSLKRVSDSTTGWVAGGILSSVLVGTSGSERVYGALFPETNLTSPDQLTMHLRSGGVSKYAILNINGEFIADSFKPKSAEQTRRNINIPTIGGGELTVINAPSGVEDGKYYPIIINANYYSAYMTGYQIDIVTASGAGSYPMSCNTFSGYVRTGGWSDRKDGGYGYYNRYSDKEIALQSICSSSKDKDNLLFVFVEARAFPVKMRLPVGVTAEAPAAQVVYDRGKDTETIIPWGVSDPLGSYKNLQVMFDFRMGRCGFYSATTEGLYYICSGGRVGLFNGITVGEEISMTMPKLTINGMIGSSKGYVSETNANWNEQQSDNVDKFKPIVGSENAPDNTNYGGFHVGFSGNYATQFAGRNSKFYARSFEAGVDKGWRQLATLNTENLWTADNHFTGHYVFDSSHTRFIRHIAYSTTTVNTHITTWGTSSAPLNYEVKAVDTNGAQTSLKVLFTAKYLSDGSATLAVNGNITCTSVTQSSDRDLKDNIQVIGDATEAIRKMNGYTYTLKENGLPYAGVIAQEVMEALPEAVGSFTHYGEVLQGPTIDGNELREETRYLNVDYAAVTGLLVQVARETDNRVTELEEENASLRDNIAAMDERIAKLEELVSKLTGSKK
ncbi:TPA: tail fiber domain-containing protein [Escherichia coli]